MMLPARIENYSGYKSLLGAIPIIKKKCFYLVDIKVSGDAPKDFIRVYDYENGVRKDYYKTWPQYIAKVGQKWYPMESITEQLMTRIGNIGEFNMAQSKLMMAGSQLRFLSRYFLTNKEILVHAAEVFAGYLGGDRDFAEEIEKKNMARELFTFQFAEKALKWTFQFDWEHILDCFIKMLLFDAITGNNDRHFYNWGIITHLQNKKRPRFAPIYDSARGLFWNHKESQLVEYLNTPGMLNERLLKYAENSQPKTGWDGMGNINHFQLIDKISGYDKRYKEIFIKILDNEYLDKLNLMIDNEFNNLMSETRRTLIKMYLALRIEKLYQIIN
jgi:HipA-like C-terminal domain